MHNAECRMEERAGHGGGSHGSVEKTEEPEGNAVGAAGFEVVDGEEGVGGVGNLPERFGWSADFEEVAGIDEEVAAGRGGEEMARGGELGEEERLAESAGIGAWGKGVHEVGVAAVDLAGGGKGLELGFSGRQEGEETCAVEGVEDAQALLAVDAERTAEGGDVGRLGYGGGQDGQHAAGVADGLGLDRFRLGPVGVENLVGGGKEHVAEGGAGIAEEGVGAVAEIGFEMGEDDAEAVEDGA